MDAAGSAPGAPASVLLGPGNVDEVGKQRVRRLPADEIRDEVQVVVVEEDGRVRLALELGQTASANCRLTRT